MPLVPLPDSVPVRIALTDASPTESAGLPLSVSLDNVPALVTPLVRVLSASTAPVSVTPTTSLSLPLTVIVNVAVSVPPFPSEIVYVKTSVSLEPSAMLSAAS